MELRRPPRSDLNVQGIGGTPPIRGEVTWGDRWTTVDYPPFFLYGSAIVGRIYGALFSTYPDTLPLLIAVKLPVLLATVGLTGVLFVAVRRITGRDQPARWAALAYWLNPAVLFGGEMLGLVDALCFLPAIAGLVLVYFHRPWVAGVLLGVAVSTKPQGVLIAPAVAVAVLQSGDLLDLARIGASFCATVVLVVLPYTMGGALPNMWLAFGSFGERRDTMSACTANVGWIVNWWLRSWLALPSMGLRAFVLMVPRPLAVSRVRELGYPESHSDRQGRHHRRNPMGDLDGEALTRFRLRGSRWRVHGSRVLRAGNGDARKPPASSRSRCSCWRRRFARVFARCASL